MYNSPYKPVPPPKPLGGNAPPYRVPPPFPMPGTPGRHERHPIDPSAQNPIAGSGNGYGPHMSGPTPTVISQQEFDHSREHYHTHSSKFPVEKNIEINDHDKETLEDSRFRSKIPLAGDAQRYPVPRSSWRGTVFPSDGSIRPPAPGWQRDPHPDGHQGYWELSRIRPPFPHANGSTSHQHSGGGHPPPPLVYHPPNLPARHQPPPHVYDVQHPPQPHQNGRYRGDERDPLVYSGPNRNSNGLIGVDNPALDGADEATTAATARPISEHVDNAVAESGEAEVDAKKKTGKAKEYAEKKYSKLKGMISKFGQSSLSSRNGEKKQDSRATTPSKDSPNEEEHGFPAPQEQQQPNQNIPMQSLSGQTTPKRSPYPSRSHGDLTGVGNSRTPPVYRHSAVLGHPGSGMGPRALPTTPHFRPQHAISSESPYGVSGYDLYSRPIHYRQPMHHPQMQRQPNSLKDTPSAAEMNHSRDGLASEPLSLPGMVANPGQNGDSSMMGRNRRAGVVMDSDDDDGDEREVKSGPDASLNVEIIRNQQQRVSGMSNRHPGVGQESGSCINTSQESSDGAIALEQRKTSSETLAAADLKEQPSNERNGDRSLFNGPSASGPPPLPAEPPPTKTPPPMTRSDEIPEKPERTDLSKLRHPFMGGSTNQIAQSPKDKKGRPGGIHDSTPSQMRSEFLHFSKTSVSYAGGLNFGGRMESARPAGDGDASSTTEALESESFLDQDVSEESSNEEEVKYGRTRRHSAQQASQMRNQLEELEEIYSQVLRLLKGGKGNVPGQPNPAVAMEDLKAEFKKSQARMRRFGSVSSLPSSTTGPRYRIKDRRDDKMRRGKDSKSGNSINKRFQRLESHIVTLARSVAQLSSEMRNQHLMIQEIESLRREVAEVAAWKGISMRTGPGAATGKHGVNPGNGQWDPYRCSAPGFANPNRVKKLTKFFGTEPPLLRQFLRKLGYEKYASLFENEKIGMMELPYLSETRLEKLGVPLGPRVRILQEAQMNFGNDKYNIYIV